MRILFIASTSDWGGASNALYLLARELCKDNAVGVILPFPNGKLYKELSAINTRIYIEKYGLTSYSYHTNPIKWAIKTLEMIIKRSHAKNRTKNIISDFKPDIVHTNVGPLDIALEYCIKNNIPHVWHHREYQEQIGIHFYPSTRTFNKYIHLKGNYNIAITQGLFCHLNLREGIDRTIYDGVFSDKEISHLNIGARKKQIICVGRIEPSKGIMELLSAFSIFSKSHQEYDLLIIGSASESEYYRKCLKYASENCIPEKIHFMGELDKEDVFNIMSDSECLVSPSKSEGFGFVTIEAMMNGCIVIGRNVSGLKEQFDLGQCYSGKEIALRFNSETELLCCLEDVSENRHEELRKSAFQYATNSYSIEKSVNNTIDYYNEILGISHE